MRLPSLGDAARLVLVRHGEPVAESRGRVYGRIDYELSDEGRAQAEETAAWIADSLTAHAIYSSPLLRARQTAAALALRLGLEPAIRPGLRELDFGVCEGLTYDEVQRLHPALARDFLRNPSLVRFPEGEAVAELIARAEAVVSELRAAHLGQTVVLFAHGGSNRAILSRALGLPADALFRVDQSFAAVSVIDYFDEAAVVRLCNALPPRRP